MIKFLIDPFNIFWLLLLLTVSAWYFKKEHLLRYFFITMAVWFLAVSTPLLPNLLLNSLEDRYEPLYIEQLENLDAEYHIIILGGGHGYDDRLPANSLLSLQALARLNEGIRLNRLLPNSLLVLSGYSASGRVPQAIMLRDAALLLGVEREDILVQTRPGNTKEEAKEYSERFGANNPVILVTSASHMPRAVNMFERFGIDVIPSPANYRLIGNDKFKWIGLPSMKNISNLRRAFYEYAAIIRNRLF